MCMYVQIVSVRCAAASCGSRSDSLSQAFVINGQDAVAGRWPWQVAVFRAGGGVVCGGSLISENHVITAAHCFP